MGAGPKSLADQIHSGHASIAGFDLSHSSRHQGPSLHFGRRPVGWEFNLGGTSGDRVMHT